MTHESCSMCTLINVAQMFILFPKVIVRKYANIFVVMNMK